MHRRAYTFGVVVLMGLLTACTPVAASVRTSAPAQAPSTVTGAQTTSKSVRVSGLWRAWVRVVTLA